MSEKLAVKKDERGLLAVVFNSPETGQLLYSTSKPNVVRGNHYHNRKKEYFCVIEGQAKITQKNRETGEREEQIVSGEVPEVVAIKTGWPHNIKNLGQNEMKLLVWTSEIFDPKNPDTFYEEV